MRVLLSLAVFLFAAGVLANPLPVRDIQAESLAKIPMPGHSLAPAKLPDGKDLPIEMVSEQVDLVLLTDGKSIFLDVDATFTMRNHGPAYTMGVAYPIGPRNNMVSFQAETEGVIHKHILSKNTPDEGCDSSRRPTAFWYEWEFTFPAHEVSMHKVKYRLTINTRLRTGYTVSTGGPWKGKISKSVITLSVDDSLGWGHVREFGPSGVATQQGARMLWNYADYDPGTEHDIFISVDASSWADRVAANQAGDTWAHRKNLCGLMRDAHFATGRVARDAERDQAYAEALIKLIENSKSTSSKLILERSDTFKQRKTPDAQPEYEEELRDRPYVANPDELLAWLPEVEALAPKLVDRDLAERLLRPWLELGEAAGKDRLYAGSKKLRLSDDQQRAARKHQAALRPMLPAKR